MVKMWLATVGLLLLALCASPSVSRDITHEDIKDVMLSLVHMMRDNTEKLERHEARERLLGEQMKKAINTLTKRISVIEGFKTHLTRIDERIAGIEQVVSQGDERQRIQMQKAADSIEDLESRLEGWLTNIDNKISESNSRTEATPLPKLDETIPVSDILARLNDSEAVIAGHVAKIEHGLDTMATWNKDKAAIHGDKIQAVFGEVQDISGRLGDIETSLEKIQESSKKQLEKPTESVPDISPAIEEQTRALTRVRDLLQDTADRIQELPRIAEIQALHNETQTSLQETKHALEDVIARGVGGIDGRVMETKEEIKDSVGALRTDLANNAERVNEELHNLVKGQSVMVTTADEVLDTKKRVEYGVRQIRLEIGDLVQAQSASMNKIVNQRFDGFSNDIIDNQNGALANLTTKIEQEINQVWRQINVMYQQMTASAQALDKLHKQNEEYVNSTTSTMDGMTSKVGLITTSMIKVDDNLNFLLGQLSLVTQEFNQIKIGLGAALDKIKASFKEVQEQANGLSHPGPHPVPENHNELEEEATQPSTDLPNHILDDPTV